LDNPDFLLVAAESPLVSVSDNTVTTDSVSTDFRLLQTSLPVPTLRTRWMQQANLGHDHSQRAYVIMTAVLLTALLCENGRCHVVIM